MITGCFRLITIFIQFINVYNLTALWCKQQNETFKQLSQSKSQSLKKFSELTDSTAEYKTK